MDLRDLLTRGTLLLLAVGCAPTAVVGGLDPYGCERPPADVFTAAGVDVRFAESTFSKIVTGSLEVSSEPQVVSLLSQAASDERVMDYLRCLALRRDKYTPEQVVYITTLKEFAKTRPTPEAFIAWQKENRFPGSPGGNGGNNDGGSPVPDGGSTTGTVGAGGNGVASHLITPRRDGMVTVVVRNTSPGNKATKNRDLDRFTVFDARGSTVARGSGTRIEPGSTSTATFSATAGVTYRVEIKARVERGVMHLANYEVSGG